MKRIFFLASCTAIMGLMSCDKKDLIPEPPYECTTCTAVPEAVAANDNINKGIYKGFIIGSTGTIKFNIDNTGTGITAVMVLDGITVNLTSSVAWVSGEPYIAPFTGVMNGNPVSITFSVDVSGQTPTITASNIPGHANATLVVVKELSNSMVETFEGSYTTTDPETGTFNIILSRSLGFWGGASRATGSTIVKDHSGSIINNAIVQDNITMGVLSGDNLTGSFLNSGGATVNITGRRTL